MPESSSGKWVQRAGSTGGGRTYRGQRPVNWYASLVVIVVLGLASIVYARYEYVHGSSSSTTSTVEPTVGKTWNAGFLFDICGVQEPSPPASTEATALSMSTPGNGVIDITPKTASEAGNNAVLGVFTGHYPKMVLNETEIAYPGQKTYTNGEKCASGTPDAGKVGQVQARYWPNALDSSVSRPVSGNPADLKLGNPSLVTMAFLPPGAKIPRPPGSVVSPLLTAYSQQGQTSTTTTAPASVTPSTTPSTVPVTTTTAPASTTTAPKSTTTTTK